MTAAWVPTAGQTAYLRSTGESVAVMDFREERVYVRPLRGGRETALRVGELIPPDDAPGGLHDWQVSRG
ncbi:hypothetical protein [Kitasatospora sp. MAP5-34]|uniref:hypothetical protein n=1 Tax=Kitasatospora sp. MAP5-34 TaxID=3035102 RepID=UPI0024743E75|nr:hypothetical protein [Kitasatospora sp. MAP5-34]MDH6578605.1 hypothetical protein [Kitasatospora sp. MAP5-34]